MRTPIISIFSILFLLLVVSCQSEKPEGDLDLHYTAELDTVPYEQKSLVTVVSNGDSFSTEIRTSGVQTWQVVDTTLQVDFTTSTFKIIQNLPILGKITFDSESEMPKKASEAELKLRNEFSAVKDEIKRLKMSALGERYVIEETPKTAFMLEKFMIPHYPDFLLAVEDSWTDTIQLTSGFPIQMALTYTITEIGAEFVMAKLTGNIQLPESTSAIQNLGIQTIGGNVEGNMRIQKSNSKVLEGNIIAQYQVEAKQMGQIVNLNIHNLLQFRTLPQ